MLSRFAAALAGAIDGTEEASGVADINAGLVDVASYDRAGTDHHMVANSHRQDGCVRADGDVLADARWPPQLFAAARRPAGLERVVDEHYAMTNEAILPNLNQLANKAVRLHSRAGADIYTGLNLHEWSDKAVIAYVTPV